MTKDGVGLLGKRGLALLRLEAIEWVRLQETRAAGTQFSLTFPHDQAKCSSKDTLVLISVGHGERSHIRLGIVQSTQTVSTFDSRVKFDLVQTVEPRSLERLLDAVSESVLKGPLTALRRDNRRYLKISPKLGQKLFAILSKRVENEKVLRRILAVIDKPKTFSDSRAMQHDAIKLALRAFGSEVASSLVIPGETALASVHLLEDAVIEHDARSINGWDMIASDIKGCATFQKDNQKLEVITANRRPLERLFGVDLIYFNEQQSALVMVQYKMMERLEPQRDIERGMTYEIGGAVDYRVEVNGQFLAEIKRMEIFERDLEPEGPYRLNSSPFYFKLVKRDAATSSAGIILALAHFQKLRETEQLTGPRGGVRISYNDLRGHYLRATSFADLVSSGYIGSRGASTYHMLTLVRTALNENRAVVAAIQNHLPKKVEKVADELDGPKTYG